MSENKQIVCGKTDSPLGPIYAALTGKKVVCVSFTCKTNAEFLKEVSQITPYPATFEDDSIQGFLQELREYFSGTRERFSYAVELSGRTSFQKKVLQATARIPYGETRSYAWLARQAGSPRAARAVGQVMAKNPVPLLIPCHRVVGSDGGLCGFAGGLRALGLKQRLLDLEERGTEPER